MSRVTNRHLFSTNVYSDRDGETAYIVNARNKDKNGEYVSKWMDFEYDIVATTDDGYGHVIAIEGVNNNNPQKVGLSAKLQDNILIFIHGFNVSEEDAIATWTIINYRRLVHSGFKGDLVVLSWEGDKLAPAGYQINVNNADNTGKNFGMLVDEIRRAKPDATINIAAHSLGNRVALSGLKYIYDTLNMNYKINNLIHLEAAVNEDVHYQKDKFYHLSGEFSNVYKVVQKIYNFYSASDDVLGKIYKLNERIFDPIDYKLGRDPLGYGVPNDPSRLPKNFINIDSEPFGIDKHSAMIQNVYEKPVKFKIDYTGEELKSMTPVKDFWEEFVYLLR